MFLLLMDNKLRKTGSQVLANVWCLNSPETRSTPFCNHSLHFGGLTTKNLQKNNNQRAGWGNPNCIREKEENTKEKRVKETTAMLRNGYVLHTLEVQV